MGYFKCHNFRKSMMCFVAMLCVMCVLMVLKHVICGYFMTLIYFVASFITKNQMFSGASAFNGDISAWDTSSATSFVSQ
jgi:surface protein